MVRVFKPVESEKRWVHLAEEGLHYLGRPASPAASRDRSVSAALEQARRLRDQGQRDQAEEIWRGLEALFHDDPSAEEVLKQVRLDRG